MAESTGVSSSEPRAESNGGRGNNGSFFKKHRVVLIAAGAGGFLLMSHKGSKANGGSSNQTGQDQLQQEQDALAAEQSALESATLLPTSGTGAGLGDGSSTPGTSGGQIGPVNITLPGDSDSSSGKKPNPHRKPPKHHPGEPTTTKKNPPDKDGKTSNKDHNHKHTNPRNTGTHTGSGVTVHGRTFAGATHVSKGRPRRIGTDIHQTINVNYGGRTDTHVSVNNGRSWIDHPKGASPPSRGVATTHARQAPPRPVHRPVARKR